MSLDDGKWEGINQPQHNVSNTVVVRMNEWKRSKEEGKQNQHEKNEINTDTQKLRQGNRHSKYQANKRMKNDAQGKIQTTVMAPCISEIEHTGTHHDPPSTREQARLKEGSRLAKKKEIEHRMMTTTDSNRKEKTRRLSNSRDELHETRTAESEERGNAVAVRRRDGKNNANSCRLQIELLEKETRKVKKKRSESKPSCPIQIKPREDHWWREQLGDSW